MKKYDDVESYLADQEPAARATLEQVRRAIMAAAPGATETMSYGMPGFQLDGRRLVYYAAFKQHCSFFPASYEVMRTYAKELEGYEMSKGTIRMPIGKPLPAPLIRKMVKAKIHENEARRRR